MTGLQWPWSLEAHKHFGKLRVGLHTHAEGPHCMPYGQNPHIPLMVNMSLPNKHRVAVKLSHIPRTGM